MLRRLPAFACRYLPVLISTATLCLICGSADLAHSESKPAAGAVDYSGLLFTTLLADMPGKRLVASKLEWDPKSPRPFKAHRHPGDVFGYVTKGTLRFGVAGQPVQIVHAGETFFEPAGALHVVAESASATEAASAIIVQVAPDGVPLLVEEH